MFMSQKTYSGLRTAMEEEMLALDTWDLVQLLFRKSIVRCRWVYTVKVNPDGSIGHLKVKLVAKGYSQTCGVDFGDLFSCCQNNLSSISYHFYCFK